MTTTQEANTAPTLAVAFAASMELIGQLVDDGVPPPKNITTASNVEVLVSIHANDVEAWVTALDIPAPEWQAATTPDHHWVTRWASWSETDLRELPFTLIVTADRVPVLDPDLCSPACWQTDLGITG